MNCTCSRDRYGIPRAGHRRNCPAMNPQQTAQPHERERRRLQLLRRTHKPHIYRENSEWLVLERTAPGEWWLRPFLPETSVANARDRSVSSPAD